MDKNLPAQENNTVTLNLEEAIEFGITLRERGEIEAALDLFRNIVRAEPEHHVALNCLGALEHQTGDSDTGLGYIKRALEYDPDFIDAHNNLGNIYRERGNVDEARECYEKALAIDPEFPSAMWNIAEIHRIGGDFDKAIPIYKRAAALWPNNQRVLETLVLCLRITGETEEAVAILRHWLSNEPDNEAARHILAAITGENVPSRASDQFVRHLFDRFADNFDSRLAMLEYRAPEFVANAVSHHCGAPQANLAVLDLGCGTGLCGPALRPYAKHLAGIDLSPPMLERARERHCYDALQAVELTAFLAASETRFDLMISADTLCYLGRLDEVFEHAAAALNPSGHIIFTVEASDESDTADFRLCPHGRYSHSEAYIRRCAEQVELTLVDIEQVELRKENHVPVQGYIVVVASLDNNQSVSS